MVCHVPCSLLTALKRVAFQSLSLRELLWDNCFQAVGSTSVMIKCGVALPAHVVTPL
jgi:hypothetical protein